MRSFARLHDCVRQTGVGVSKTTLHAKMILRLPRPALPEFIDAPVTIAAGASSVLAIGATLASCLLRPTPKKPSVQSDDNFLWAIAGVVSLIPLFSWTAWILPAIQTEDRNQASLYYAYAALYALPLLHGGLDLDAFSVFMLLLGAIHVQTERINQTEPGLLAGLLPKDLPGRLPSGTSRSLGGLLPPDRRPMIFNPDEEKQPVNQDAIFLGKDDVVDVYRGGQGGTGDSAGRLVDPRTKSSEKRELEEFDRRLENKDKKK